MAAKTSKKPADTADSKPEDKTPGPDEPGLFGDDAADEATKAAAVDPAAPPEAEDAATDLLAAADYLKGALDAGEDILESRWLEPVMAAHGALLDAATADTERDAARALVEQFDAFAKDFADLCDSIGSTRELALAKTKAEEAAMWAARHVNARR